MRRRLTPPSVPVVARDPGGIKREMPDDEAATADIDLMPPVFPPVKPLDLEDAIRRDAVSPWKKEWHGNGAPKPVETFEEWRARKAAEKKG